MSTALAKNFYDAWHALNLEKMMTFFAEDAVVEYVGGPPYGRRIEGKKEITKFFGGVVNASKKMKLDVVMPYSTCIEAGSTVVFQSRIRLTSPGKEWAVDSPAATFFEFSEGKIHRLTVYVVNPEGTKIGTLDLKRDLSVKDIGELAVAAWVVA